jgi:hypothetical protein
MTEQLALIEEQPPAPLHGIEPGHPASEEGPEWAKGQDVGFLEAAAEVFKEHDKGLILGAFTGFKENAVAVALASGHLIQIAPGAWAVAETIGRARALKDFSGRQVMQLALGMSYCKRLGYTLGREEDVARWLARLPEPAVVEAFVEHPGDAPALQRAGFDLIGAKVRASSEIVGLYLKGAYPYEPTPPEDLPAIRELAGLSFDPAPLLAEVDALGRGFADHYSSYNKRGSWSALALRGYYDDPGEIQKPSEMSQKWKREHPADLKLGLRDTPLRAALFEAEELIRLVPGTPHRIRLMALAPGGGELDRHADITDPDAGTRDGQLCRIHLPLRTNPEVIFEGWTLGGHRQSMHMKAGGAYYLDTRKPHRAVNGGDTERLHLVIDMESCDELRWLIGG